MPDLQPYFVPLTYLGATIGVLLVLFLLAALFRRSRRRTRSIKGTRLGINEFCEIDETRRLILVRRDNVEHLVMIGGPQDLVIESGIGVSAEKKHPLDEAVADAISRIDDVVSFKAAPRAPVFGIKRPSLRAVEDPPMDDGPKLT